MPDSRYDAAMDAWQALQLPAGAYPPCFGEALDLGEGAGRKAMATPAISSAAAPRDNSTLTRVLAIPRYIMISVAQRCSAAQFPPEYYSPSPPSDKSCRRD